MRACLFCNTPLTRKNRSREHVIPRWAVSHLGYIHERIVGSTLTYPNEPSVLSEDSEILNEREQSIDSLILGSVCVTCNSGWMSGLEVAARPILESLWKGVCPKMLGRNVCDTLARWTFKTAVTLNYASNYKKIIPLEQIHCFYNEGRLPDNSTVDMAFCPADGVNWVIGGNKKFALMSTDLEESIKPSYLITLQIEALLLRLAWTPVDCVKVLEICNAVCRIFPLRQLAKRVEITGRCADRRQLHFVATIFAEDGVYPDGLEL